MKSIDEKNSINNWNDIWNVIGHTFWYNEDRIKNNFIILESKNNQLVLLSENQIESKKRFKCYLVPLYFMNDLEYHLYRNSLGGFGVEPTYHVISYLYRYRNDMNTYILIWFNAILTQEIKNHDYDFNKEISKYIHKITCDELKSRGIDYLYMYGMNRTNFSPSYYLSDCEHMYKNLDKNNFEIILECISLNIQRIQSYYRMIVIYED